MPNHDSSTQFYDDGEGLPQILPDSPFPLFKSWFDHAWTQRLTPNTNAMTLSTLHPDGYPDSRIVLCKDIDLDPGSIVFYTNYHGSKGKQIESNPFASVVFHWDHDERQIRIRGPITRATESESDAYFASRALESRLGSWISDQSQPIESREALLDKVVVIMDQLGITPTDLMDNTNLIIPRPPHWGGFRIHAQSMELWAGGVGRIHDRARWTRTLSPSSNSTTGGYEYSDWSSTRLQP